MLALSDSMPVPPDREDAAVVIVGAGHAGVQVAVSLREFGFSDRIVIVDAEARSPYQRPPLSKEYLCGTVDQPPPLRAHEFYEIQRIEFRRAAAVSIDRAQRTITLDDGSRLGYGHLVLATGARNREIPVPGANTPGVLGLRTLDDARDIRERIGTSDDIVIIGAGFIGLEVAAAARKRGKRVHVVEAVDRVMARVVSPHVSQHLADLHAREGVNVHLGRSLAAIRTDRAGKLDTVELTCGTTMAADLVVVGVGVVPNIELAAEAGLAVDNGVCVDAALLTKDPAISAVGDCAAFPVSGSGASIRLESVQNAVDHGRFVAARLTGSVENYVAVPWFWTHQYSAKLQIAGKALEVSESVVVGDAQAFSVLRFNDQTLVSVESINRPGDHLAARRILAGDKRPSPTDARSPGFSLKSFVQSATSAA